MNGAPAASGTHRAAATVGEAHARRANIDDDRFVAAYIVDIGVRQSGRPGKLLRNKRFHPGQPRLKVARCAATGR